ncbi:MAG: BrnT family toxin [Chloroflexi bacterium]|nr:BrnT family toxin [Chloroflexota bacterium]
MLILDEFEGFDWDEGNRGKNWERHRVSDVECEEVFFHEPLLVYPDEEHSDSEQRYYVLGRTDRGRCVFLVFTARGQRVRVISARDMTKRERREYPW